MAQGQCSGLLWEKVTQNDSLPDFQSQLLCKKGASYHAR